MGLHILAFISDVKEDVQNNMTNHRRYEMVKELSKDE
jgi:hypothetical protein